MDNLQIFGDSNAVDSRPELGSYRLCEFRKAHLAAIASGLVAVKAYGAWVYSLLEFNLGNSVLVEQVTMRRVNHGT